MDATGEKMKKVTVKENKVAIAKGEDKKKLTKEYLLQMIQEELKEMFDGRNNMTDVTGENQ